MQKHFKHWGTLKQTRNHADRRLLPLPYWLTLQLPTVNYLHSITWVRCSGIRFTFYYISGCIIQILSRICCLVAKSLAWRRLLVHYGVKNSSNFNIWLLGDETIGSRCCSSRTKNKNIYLILLPRDEALTMTCISIDRAWDGAVLTGLDTAHFTKECALRSRIGWKVCCHTFIIVDHHKERLLQWCLAGERRCLVQIWMSLALRER